MKIKNPIYPRRKSSTLIFLLAFALLAITANAQTQTAVAEPDPVAGGDALALPGQQSIVGVQRCRVWRWTVLAL